MFDWGSSSLSKRFEDEEEDEEFVVKFSDSEDEADSDDDTKNELLDLTIVESKDRDEPLKNEYGMKKVEEDYSNKKVDMFAQQIKFLSCLKILIQEMSTLATGFEVIGGQLR